MKTILSDSTGKMEISGFFAVIVVSCDDFQVPDLWENVLLKQAHERMFCGIRHMRGYLASNGTGCLERV